MSAVKTIADADRYGLCITVRCPGCAKDAWLKPGKLPGDRTRDPWALTFKCSACGDTAGVRSIIAGDCVEEDKRRVAVAREPVAKAA